MSNNVDFSGKPFHFIGIGGIGMSALAYILAKRQFPVSGSDLRTSHITQRLQSVGAHIFNHQDATNLEFFQLSPPTTSPSSSKVLSGLVTNKTELSTSPSWKDSASLNTRFSTPGNERPQVICSTAISESNSEYKAALEKDCPIFHRSDLLAALIKDYQSIAVAGTHGKTTTSSLIGYLLLQAGLDPTIVIGGEVNAWEGNARVGQSPYLVAEADESDGSLAKLSAQIGVVTNIELDHPDHYHSLDEVVNIFTTFAKQCKFLIGCIDCQTVREKLSLNITYSLFPETGADYTVQDVEYHNWGTTAQVWEQGQALGTLKLPLLGEHNLGNALAAVAVGRKLGLEFSTIAEALATFEGAKRRFEHRGEANGITFVDDYAHHPSEIKVTLAAAHLRVKASHQRLVAIFQPHRYSRTQTFLSEFAAAFNHADVIIITDIYSAGEADLGKITGQHLADAIAQHTGNSATPEANSPQVFYQSSLTQLRDFLRSQLQPGDLALFLGAGNLNQLIPELLSFYCA